MNYEYSVAGFRRGTPFKLPNLLHILTFIFLKKVPGLEYPEQDCPQRKCPWEKHLRQYYPGSATRSHAVLSQEPGAGPAPEILGPRPGGVTWKAPASGGNRRSGMHSFPGVGILEKFCPRQNCLVGKNSPGSCQ